MSDEMMVQNSRPSAVPYLLGGAVVGAGLGAASPWGFTKPKYASFDDVLKEYKDNDKFTKSKEAAKGDDAKKAYETIDKELEAYTKVQAEADKKVAELTEQHSAWSETLTKDETAKTIINELETAKNNVQPTKDALLAKVKDGIKNGEIAIEGLSKDDAAKLEDSALKEKAEAFIKNSTDTAKEKFKDEFEKLEEVTKKVTDKTTELEKRAAELNVDKDKIRTVSDEHKKLIDEAAKKGSDAKSKAEKAIKESMEKLKGPKRWLNAVVLASALALGALALRPKADNNI